MKQLIQALSKARPNFGAVSKAGTAIARGNAEYKYATLDDIIAATAPALAAEGLHVYHTYNLAEFTIDVTCRLTDGEHEICSTVSMPTSGVSENKNQAQAVGSLLTYGRRYSISALLCISTDADDDAQSQGKQLDCAKPKLVETAKPVIRTQEQARSAIQELVMRDTPRHWETLTVLFDKYMLPEERRFEIRQICLGKTRSELERLCKPE